MVSLFAIKVRINYQSHKHMSNNRGKFHVIFFTREPTTNLIIFNVRNFYCSPIFFNWINRFLKDFRWFLAALTSPLFPFQLNLFNSTFKPIKKQSRRFFGKFSKTQAIFCVMCVFFFFRELIYYLDDLERAVSHWWCAQLLYDYSLLVKLTRINAIIKMKITIFVCARFTLSLCPVEIVFLIALCGGMKPLYINRNKVIESRMYKTPHS